MSEFSQLTEKQFKLFNIFVTVAMSNERCPTREYLQDVHGISRAPLRHLVQLGFISVELWPYNYRVVEICKGRFKGARTLASPKGKVPNKTTISRARATGQPIATASARVRTCGTLAVAPRPDIRPSPDQLFFEKALDQYAQGVL